MRMTDSGLVLEFEWIAQQILFLFAQCCSTLSCTFLYSTSRGQCWIYTPVSPLLIFYIWSNFSVWSGVFLVISKASSHLWNQCMTKKIRLQSIFIKNVNNYASCMWSVYLIYAEHCLGPIQRPGLGPYSKGFKAFPKQKTDLHCKSNKHSAYVRNAGQDPQCNYFCSLI